MSKRITDLVATWANIFKSIPAEQLEDLKHVEDLWNEPGGQFAAISRTEVKTGSPQASSGGGAERMVAQYSDPAPQEGMMEEYRKFGQMLRSFGKAIDDVVTTQKTQAGQIDTLAGILSAAAKAQPTAKAAGPEAESCLGKAEAKMKKARAELRKADMADDEDSEEREEKKSNIDNARVALKAAKRFLVKAEDEDQDDWPDSEGAEKARREFARLTKALKKADDEERDREEAEKARAAAEATAKAEAAAAEAAKAETAKAEAAAAETTKKAEGGEATEEKDDEEKTEKAVATPAAPAAKAAEYAPIDPALRNQIEVMNTSIKGLMEKVMGASKGSPVPPTFAKAMPMAALSEKVETAIEDGTLTEPTDIMKAHTLVTHVRAVQDGKMDAAIVDDEIAKSSENVRQLFTAQAA